MLGFPFWKNYALLQLYPRHLVVDASVIGATRILILFYLHLQIHCLNVNFIMVLNRKESIPTAKNGSFLVAGALSIHLDAVTVLTFSRPNQTMSYILSTPSEDYHHHRHQVPIYIQS